MDLSGKIEGGGWTVTACAHEQGDEFGCRINTSIAAPDGAIAREFAHNRTFCTAQEAVLEGLKEGMSWVGLTTSNTVSAN
jgi:hypothetical protein